MLLYAQFGVELWKLLSGLNFFHTNKKLVFIRETRMQTECNTCKCSMQPRFPFWIRYVFIYLLIFTVICAKWAIQWTMPAIRNCNIFKVLFTVSFYNICSKEIKVVLSFQGEDFNWTLKGPAGVSLASFIVKNGYCFTW